MTDWCELGVGRAGSYRRMAGVTTLKCDRYEELIWSGTTDGRLTSHWINQSIDQTIDQSYQSINQRVSVPAHNSSVLFIQSFPTGLLSLSEFSMLYHSRGGVQVQSFNQSINQPINQSTGQSISQFTAAQVPDYSPNIVLLAAQTINPSIAPSINQTAIIAYDLTTNQSVKQSTSDQPVTSINCSSSSYAFGRTDGLIELRDYRSIRSIIKLSAHVGPIVDCLIDEHYIVTCGMTQPINPSLSQSINQSIHQSNRYDPIIKVFDVRTYRPLPPIIPRMSGPPARIGWMDQSINQSMSSGDRSIYVVTRHGEWQSASVKLSMMQGPRYQCSMLDQSINQTSKVYCADLSQNGENMIIGDSAGLIHRFAKLKGQSADMNNVQQIHSPTTRSITTRLDHNVAQSNDFADQSAHADNQSNNPAVDPSSTEQPTYSSALNNYSQETPYAPTLLELYQSTHPSINQSLDPSMEPPMNPYDVLSFDGAESFGSIYFPYELNSGLVSDWSSIKQSVRQTSYQQIDHRSIPNVQWHNNIGYVNLRANNQSVGRSTNRSNTQLINQAIDQYRVKGLVVHAPKTVLSVVNQADYDRLIANSEYSLQSIKQSVHQSITQAINRSIKQFNQSPFTCLDSMLPNSYCNVLLINQYFIQPIKINFLNHLCARENCLRCELGFLFHMMDSARINQSGKQPTTHSNARSSNQQQTSDSNALSVSQSSNQSTSQPQSQPTNQTITSNNQQISQPAKPSGGALAEPRNFLRALSQIPEAIGLGLLDEMDYRQSINQMNIQSFNLHKNWPKEPLTVKIKPSVNQVPLIDRIQSCQRFILEQLRKEETIDQSGSSGKQASKQSNKQTPKRDKRNNQSGKSPKPEANNQSLTQSSSQSSQSAGNRFLMDQVFGHMVEFVNECEGPPTRAANQSASLSSHQTVSRSTVMYEKLTYSHTVYTSSSPLPQTVYVNPTITFTELLSSSLTHQSINRFWCHQCSAYRIIKAKRRVVDLPNVLNIEVNIQDKHASSIWKQQSINQSPTQANNQIETDSSNTQSISQSADQSWLPLYLAFEVTDTDTKVTRLTESEARARINQPADQSINQWIYELTSVISMITDPPSSANRSDEHFVMHRKIPDNYINQSTNQSINQSHEWYVFNDFVIRPSSSAEATNFQYSWKQPCLLMYQLMSSNQPMNVLITPPLVNPFSSLPFTYQKSLALRPSPVRTFLPFASNEQIDSSLRVAIDCEFVCMSSELSGYDSVTGELLIVRPARMQLARVSIVRVNGVPVMDDYILANEPIVDYLTRYSGLKQGDLDRASSTHHLTTLKQTYIRLRHLIDHGVTFIGHGLESDFRVCNLVIPPHQVIDTVKLYSLPHQRKLSLRFLAVHLLGLNIQKDVHDSIEDARTALALVKHYEAIEQQENGKQKIQAMIQQLYAIGRSDGFKI